MELFGIGLSELFFIVIIALIVLGPKDMAATGRKIGGFLRKLITSPEWRTFQDTSREVRNLPNRLMREAGLEEMQNKAGEMNKQVNSALDTNSILPPTTVQPRRPQSVENPVAPSITEAEQKKDAEAS